MEGTEKGKLLHLPLSSLVISPYTAHLKGPRRGEERRGEERREKGEKGRRQDKCKVHVCEIIMRKEEEEKVGGTRKEEENGEMQKEEKEI